MVKRHALNPTEYGFDGYSGDALRTRIDGNVSPQCNVATFHLVPRPGLDGHTPQGDPMFLTLPSTGFALYTTVYGRVEHEVRINQSHSEHQIIATLLKDLGSRGDWPARYVIDWIYTERPACPDVWFKHTRVADGCDTEITNLETNQRYRRWDVGDSPANSPYALRDDLEIAIFSSFDSASEIKKSVVMNPIRKTATINLYNALVNLYQDSYAAEGAGSEEYDLVEYEQAIPERAMSEAEDALPTWQDYNSSLTATHFEQKLREEAEKCLQEARGRLASA